MKILAVADEPSKALWDYFDPARLEGIDLILSAGDLPAEYLSFLVTFAPCPVFYIRGNHDDRYDVRPPEGCECIEDTLITYKGVRILGLGGSLNYNGGRNQYTEKEMQRRIAKMRLKLHRSKGFDILLTHAPVRGLGDQEDLPHRGFECFGPLIEKYQPAYMIHGHIHMNYGAFRQRTYHVGRTTIVNAYERYIIEL